LLTAGRREFYRYRNVRISGVDGLATVYTSATTNGTLIAICTAGTSASDSTRTCADVVSTLEFASGKPVMLAARSDYVSGLSRVIGTLNGVRASGDATLERAKRATDQASAAGAIARAYYRASADVRRLRAGASLITDNAALADAMRGIADGYTAIDRAARKGDAGGYRAGQAAVQKRSAALTQMLQGLTRSGYVGT
jgi:hypothetical protein